MLPLHHLTFPSIEQLFVCLLNSIPPTKLPKSPVYIKYLLRFGGRKAMSLKVTLLRFVAEVNPWIVLLAAAAQILLAAVWYKFIVNATVSYYLAADKGVRRVEHILNRYPPALYWIITFVAAALRILSIATVVIACKGDSLPDYQLAALLVVGISCVNQHLSFHHQRPLPLLLADFGYELAAALLASAVYYGIKASNFF
uniref:Uncharacterized protein TCIL3000_9_3600 n=1 Tax=Trypanosoma congolense (strain IL3000) TaxID=1068625 RepID=G0UU98_TRYCI|nr:unnamed protein product [Trypanosoma congolense IL3000]